jgi:gliding motility-associated-like protein
MTITVNPNVTPTFTQVAPICQGVTLAALPTTSNNGITGTWAPALNNNATTTYTFTPSAGQCATTATMTITVNPNVTPTFTQVPPICQGGTLATLPTTSNNGIIGTWAPALNNNATTTYTFTPNTTANCELTTTMTIVVNPLPNAGNDGAITLCSNNAAVDLFSLLGGTPQTGGVWTPAMASGTGLFNPSVDPAGTYTYTVNGITPCGSDSAVVVVTVVPAPNAGIDGTATFCADSAPVDLFTFLGGTPQTGGVWSPALASGTGVYDPLVDTAGVYTYTITGTAPCADAIASASVTVNPIPFAGLDATLEVCANSGVVDLYFVLGGTPDANGTWSPALASGTSEFDPSVDLAGTYTYTVIGDAPCGSDSSTLVITIIPAPNAGTDGTANFCADSTPADLFTFLGGTPQTGGTWTPALASGTGVFDPALDTAGTYTYTVSGTAPCTDATASATVIVNPIPNAGTDGAITLCSNGTSVDLINSLTGTPMTGGTWTPALASGTGVFDPTIDTAGTYIYTVTGVAPCGNDTATVTVTIITAPNAGTDGTANFCADSAPADLVTFLGGTPQTGGTWSPALASGTGVFDPALDTAGTYTYTVTGTAPCVDATASVTVIVNPIPNAGTDGAITLCSNGTSVDLFNSLTGTPMTGGTWTPALASGTGVFDPTIDTAGTYTYTVTGVAPCGSATATVTVTIITSPNAGTDGTANFCADSAPTDLFTFLGGTPQTGGTWSPALASGTGVFNPAVDTAGAYSYTVNGIAPCFTGSASATVTVNPIPNAGQDGTITLCSNATAVDLFASLGGTPQTGGTWSPALTSGTGLFDPTVDAAGTYTYTINGIAPCGTDSATVTVTITAGPNAGADASVTFCANGASSDLFTALGVNAQTGGTWSPPLVSGTGVFNPALDFAGQYTYTVPGTGTCNPDSAIVTVSITTPPNFGAGTLTATNVCQNTNVVVTIAGSSLVDGNYTFDYSVSNANPTNGTTTTVTITSGGGQFTIPGTYFQTAGATTITLNAVTALAGNCTTPNIGATTTLTILPLPTLGNATVTIANSCLGTDATVAISGATTLANGTYTLTYQVSGANSSSATVNVLINNGSGTFIIPNADLINAGVNQFSIATLISQITTCGNSTLNFTPVSFTIENPTAPTLTGTPTFCIDANATVADLTSLLNGSGTIVWYATATGGTALNATDVLQDGITYYAAVQSPAGCESTRLDVVVTVEQCLPDAIIIPDGFSPNNDGVNDEFVIKNIIENYPNFTIEIFNRYGNVLFNGNRNNPNWNGKSSEGTNMGNGYAPAGVYFYILNFNDGSLAPIQGRLYLSR